MTSHLIIPDSHAIPGKHNDRYEWLANLVLDKRPDIIINIGDWFDMPSLSSYDKGKKSFEGRRYIKDIEAGRNALERFHGPLRAYNATAKEKYTPRLVSLEGNHEERLNRMVEYTPELDGAVSYKDFGFEEYGWEWHPFLEIVKIDGVHYSHYFTSGNSSMAVGGAYPAAAYLRQNLVSTTAGHNHLLDYCQRTCASGSKINGLSVGCYFDYNMNWASSKNNMNWWRGVVIKNGVKNGNYDLETISVSRIKKVYG